MTLCPDYETERTLSLRLLGPGGLDDLVNLAQVNVLVPFRSDSSPMTLNTSGFGHGELDVITDAEQHSFGCPALLDNQDWRSLSMRRRSLPRCARARKAETTIVPFLPVVGVAINSPFQLSEPYSSKAVAVNDYWSAT